MKKCGNGSKYATNNAGVIKAPRKPADQPKSDVVKGNDLRTTGGKK